MKKLHPSKLPSSRFPILHLKGLKHTYQPDPQSHKLLTLQTLLTDSVTAKYMLRGKQMRLLAMSCGEI